MFGMITRSVTRSQAFSTEALKVVNNVAKQQFLINMRGDEAVIKYEQNGKNIVFHTTNVPEIFQGKGVGKILAQHAFDHAKQNKLNVVCKCHFLANYYNKNIDNYKKLKVTLDLEEEEQ